MTTSYRLSGTFWLLLIPALLISGHSYGYPIDAYEDTGIRRLDYYRLAQTGEIEGKKLHEGAKLNSADIVPRLSGQAAELPPVNAEISKKIARMIPSNPERYSIAVLDLSNPDNPVYAEHNSGYSDNVGSIGKVLVALAFLSKLADVYPDDIERRKEILRNTQVVADEFSFKDHHKVRFWDVDKKKLAYRTIKTGDSANLYEYLDWALSPSSNAAAAMVQRELLLLSHFGTAYPVSQQQTQDFLNNTSKTQLGKIFRQAMDAPLIELGLDTEMLRQGSFFTRTGKARVPGTSSYGNPRQLIKLLYLLETGNLIDPFTSTELKRLLYLTERRIRYASHPNLHPFAVYFKTGSLYSCRPEEGFECGKYQGNKRNVLASLAIVEAPAENPDYHYLVVVQSNVLRVNSAVAHQTLASRIHKLIVKSHSTE